MANPTNAPNLPPNVPPSLDEDDSVVGLAAGTVPGPTPEPVPGPPVPDVTHPPEKAPDVGAIQTVQTITPKRRGASISAKMITTTTLLLVVVVALFGALNVLSTQKLIEEASSDKISQFKQSLGANAVGQVKAIATSSSALVINRNENDLQAVVNALGQNRDIVYAYFLYPDGTVAAHTDVTKYPPPNPDGSHDYRKIEGAPPELEKASWKVLPTDQSKWLLTKDGTSALFATPITSVGAVEGDKVGMLVVAYSLKFVTEQTERANTEKRTTRDKALVRTAEIGAIFVLMGLLLAIFQALRISKPVKALAFRANQIARGDLDTRVEVTSNDEIGVLGESFNFMADQLVVLLRQTAEKATMEKELEVARTIQETLVPQEDIVNRGAVNLAGYFQPASQCGGDWWTWHELLDGRILVVIGDVTGHGVPSAMITAAAKAACDTVRAMTNDKLNVTLLLEIMNRAIFESAKRKFVMTCFASIFDPKTRKITFGNAGHNFPYLYRVVNGRGEFGCLMTRGNRLGDMMESKYVEQTMDLQKDDVLVWYTDGIVECENDRGEEYGEKRFRASIRRAASQTPGELRDSVVKASMQFFGETPRKDDITMVVARVV